MEVRIRLPDLLEMVGRADAKRFRNDEGEKAWKADGRWFRMGRVDIHK